MIFFPLYTFPASLTLISVDPQGKPGTLDSGRSISNIGFPEFRRSEVLDNGRVYFMSSAVLSNEDTNLLTIDFYLYDAGQVVVLDLPNTNGPLSTSCFKRADSHCFWGAVNSTGSHWYALRESLEDFNLPVYLFSYGSKGSKVDLHCAPFIGSVDFSGSARKGVYSMITQNEQSHIFLHDFTDSSNTIFSITKNADGDAFNGNSFSPSISADGERIVFSSDANGILPEDTNDFRDIYRYDSSTKTFTYISQRFGPASANAHSPASSSDGNVICFASVDPNFGNGLPNESNHLYIFEDNSVGTLLSSDFTADGDSLDPRLSADARFVVFRSNASNLIPGLANGKYQIYVVDRDTQRITCVSSNSLGDIANEDCSAPEISPRGRYITFASKATNLFPGDTNEKFQVYRADRGNRFENHAPRAIGRLISGPETHPISFYLHGEDLDLDPLLFSLESLPSSGSLKTKNGSVVALTGSYESDSFPWQYVPSSSSMDSFEFKVFDGVEDSNLAKVEIRIVDSAHGSISRVSESINGMEGREDSFNILNGLGNVDMSDDGSFLLFDSRAEEFDIENDNGLSDVFLLNVVANTFSMVSFGLNGNHGSAVLSGDASTVAFYTQDGNQLLLQNVSDNRRTVIDTFSSDLTSPPSISRDGSRLAYTKEAHVYLFEKSDSSEFKRAVSLGSQAQLSANGNVLAFVRESLIYLFYVHNDEIISTGIEGRSPCLSSTGKYLAYLSNEGEFFRKNLWRNEPPVKIEGCDEIPETSTKRCPTNITMSADGRFLYYTKNDEDLFSQAYCFDTTTSINQPQLVSHTNGKAVSDDDSFAGAISAEGHRIVFASESSQLIPNDLNTKRDIFVIDFGLPENVEPLATLSSIELFEDEVEFFLELSYSDVENNDVEVEIVRSPKHVLHFIPITQTMGQEFVRVLYQPGLNFSGSDHLQYRVRDGSGFWSAVQEVPILVTEVHDPELTLTDRLVLFKDETQKMITSEFIRISDADYSSTVDLASNLEIRFLTTPIQGVLQDRNGDPVNQSVPYTNFPLTYLPNNASSFAFELLPMKAIDTADPEANESEVVTLQILTGVEATKNILLEHGWNLISFNQELEKIPLSILFHQGNGSVAAGNMWSWDEDSGALDVITEDKVSGKKGYWIYALKAEEVKNIPVKIMNDPLVAVTKGWNLLGPVGLGVSGDIPSQGVKGTIWNWDSTLQRYKLSKNFLKDQGYWIYATGELTNLELRLD